MAARLLPAKESKFLGALVLAQLRSSALQLAGIQASRKTAQRQGKLLLQPAVL